MNNLVPDFVILLMIVERLDLVPDYKFYVNGFEWDLLYREMRAYDCLIQLKFKYLIQLQFNDLFSSQCCIIKKNIYLSL